MGGWSLSDHKERGRPRPRRGSRDVRTGPGAAPLLDSTDQPTSACHLSADALLVVVLTVLGLFAGTGIAQESESEGQSLGQAAEDPTASLMSLQIADLYNASFYDLPGDESANTVVLRPVIPFHTGEVSHIFRATIPFLTDHPLLDAGLSDVTLFDLIVFNEDWGRWGLGPVALLPTGGEDRGVNEWALGPAIGFTARQDKLIWGLFNPALSTRAIRLHSGADDPGFHLQETRRTEAPGRRCAEHPHHPDGRCGTGHASTYGGEINTPTLDRVAKMGVSFNRFHSTAMCSPTRAALLTGRNHTRVGNGQIAAIANDFDGFSGTIPKSSATVAEVLKNYGYNTGAWGKWHNTPEEQITSKGPFDYWPTGYGFEYFYGFLAGEASQYEPTLTRNTTPVTEHLPKGYHLTDDIATDAITWLREQKAYAPDKPFFMYWAPGASHGPHQVMKEWADKYKGKFDDGWDKYRERVFAKAEGQGLDSAERTAHAAPRVDGFVGFDSRGRKAVPASAHGSLRRFHRARRLQRGPRD
jgi:hypothetical protein